MNIKCRLARFDHKYVFLLFFMCSFIIYACPNFLTTCTLMFTFMNPERFLQFHPTVMLVAYFNSCFIMIRQN